MWDYLSFENFKTSLRAYLRANLSYSKTSSILLGSPGSDNFVTLSTIEKIVVNLISFFIKLSTAISFAALKKLVAINPFYKADLSIFIDGKIFSFKSWKLKLPNS